MAAFEHPMHHGARRAGLLREAERLAHLAEDLALPERHRVETRGDPEEVPRHLLSLAGEARARHLGDVEPAPAGHQVGQTLERPVVVRDAVDLGAVARGDDDALAHHSLAAHAVERLAHLVGGQGDSLAHRPARLRAAEAPAEEQEPRLAGHHRKLCARLR